MDEPQVWTLIGVFAATMIGLITVITQLLMKTLSVKFDGLAAQFTAQFGAVNERIDGLKAEMVLRFKEVDRRFEQVDQRFEQVDRRLDRLEVRVERLEGEVQTISRKVSRIEGASAAED